MLLQNCRKLRKGKAMKESEIAHHVQQSKTKEVPKRKKMASWLLVQNVTPSLSPFILWLPIFEASLHLWKRNFQASNLQMNETISFYIISRFFHGDSWTWNVHDDGRAFGIGINTLFLCSVTSLQKWLMLKRKRNTTLFFMALDKEIVHAIYN